MLNRSDVTGVGLNKETNEESSKNAFPTILINHEDTSLTPAGTLSNGPKNSCYIKLNCHSL